MARKFAAVLGLALPAAHALAVVSADSSEIALDAYLNMNPIRKVVTLLQQMQQQVEAEGKKEKDLFDKYMCYCKTNGGDLTASIEASNAKVPAVQSDITASEEKLELTKDQLANAQQERTAAKSAMQEATALREKEAAAFAKEKAEADTNIAAIEKAVAALEHGMAGGFLQTPSAKILKRVISEHQLGNEEDRQTLMSFLSAGSAGQYAPQSGEITGILKEIGDEMRKSRTDTVNTDNTAIQNYQELMAAKKKEVLALTEAVETKSLKVGELGVAIAQLKNELTDSEEALIADQKFLAELQKGCSTKGAEWDERQKTRAEELVAIADTIKVLNDDDALDLFKHTLPGASSLIQVQSRAAAVRDRALTAVKEASKSSALAGGRPGRIDLIALALTGKKVGFEKVITMVDDMVETLRAEQVEDDHKQEYCGRQMDIADDKKKHFEQKASDAEATIEAAEDGVATLAEEIKGLQAGLKALDKAVTEATEDRKEEHEAFAQLIAHNGAAKELLQYAQNRLHKFYNPKLHKAAPKRELTQEERIAVNMGGTPPPTEAPGGIAGTGIAVLAEIAEHTHTGTSLREAPPPPPETFGAYASKDQETNGVVAMINLLIKDLDKEITESQTAEKDAQSDYEASMADSAEKRAADSKSLVSKEGAKADLEASAEEHREGHAMNAKELAATAAYISSLHAECDWLLQYFDARKEARASEVDSLNRAKAVLSGADYSLVQKKALRGRA